MKRTIATILAAALIVPATAASAQMTHRTVVVRDRDARHVTVYRFNQGDRFDRNRATHYGRLNYKQYRKLTAPTRGATWIRAGDDALLVNLTNNRILRVVRNVF